MKVALAIRLGRYTGFKRMQRFANGFPSVTSTSLMKTAVAFMMALMLLSIVAVCPLMACAIAVGSDGGDESCCHKSQQAPASCPRTTVRDCPYVVLENAKTPGAGSPVVAFTFLPAATDIAVSPHCSILSAESRLPNSAGLFLRICVMRV
jgi:hypothetical protein